MKYRRDIDGLRAIAVLLVVLFHIFPFGLPGGFIGVDIFFVISGFLISKIIFTGVETKNFSFKSFYSRRIKRIFPALIIVLLSSFFLGWFLLLPKEFVQLGWHIFGSATFISNFVLAHETGYFEVQNSYKPLLHLWSLAVEEQFYLTYPLLIFVTQKLKINILWTIAIIGGTSFCLNIAYSNADSNATFYLPQFRVWELSFGGIIAYLDLNYSRSSERFAGIFKYLSIVGFLLIWTSSLFMNSFMALPGWSMLVPTMASCFVIFAGPNSLINKKILGNEWLVNIGLISYPLYLWHWLLISFVNLTYAGSSPYLFRLLAAILSILLAALTFQYIEKPIRYGTKRSRISAGILTLLLAIGALGLLVQREGGFKSRFPPVYSDMDATRIEETELSRKFGNYGSCWVATEEFKAACAGSGTQGPLLLLWGDSHAGSLFPGLRESQTYRQYRLAQFNRNNCPPVVDISNETCRKNNEYVLSKIKETQPDVVLMFALWNSYELKNSLSLTLKKTKEAGAKSIVVIGPPPQWKSGGLPQTLFNFYRQHPLSPTPQRMSFGLIDGYEKFDEEMREAIENFGYRYFSLRKVMCNEAEGCLTYISDFPGTLTTWDYGHLSISAAKFIIESLQPTN